MIYTHAAAAIVSGALCAAGAWQIQEWRFDAKEKAHAEQKLVEVRQSAATTVRRLDTVLMAQSESATRSIRLRTDLDRSESELERLRAQLAKPMPRAETSSSSCHDRADPARELLATCAAELVEMGGIADRHASDALMLQQAWPK